MLKILVFIFISVNLLGSSNYFFYFNGKKITLNLIKKSNENSKIYNANTTKKQFFQTDSNETIAIKNEVTLSIYNKNSLDDLQAQYGFKIKKELSKSRYIILLDTWEDALDMANNLSNNPNVRYAYPNYLRRVTYR